MPRSTCGSSVLSAELRVCQLGCHVFGNRRRLNPSTFRKTKFAFHPKIVLLAVLTTLTEVTRIGIRCLESSTVLVKVRVLGQAVLVLLL